MAVIAAEARLSSNVWATFFFWFYCFTQRQYSEVFLDHSVALTENNTEGLWLSSSSVVATN